MTKRKESLSSAQHNADSYLFGMWYLANYAQLRINFKHEYGSRDNSEANYMEYVRKKYEEQNENKNNTRTI